MQRKIKIKPSTKKDKERLYEEIWEHKGRINTITENNYNLITENEVLRKENTKMQKIFGNVDSYIHLQSNSKTHQVYDSFIVLNLKL